MGITNNHLNISLPGNLYMVTSHAQDTPRIVEIIPTNINITKVLRRYSARRLLAKCPHSSVDGENIYEITVIIGIITIEVIRNKKIWSL
ncbi:MAG: hypothetical protein P8J94_04005 [Gammaproteobacteria bacterium]|nr:hypothetical protein [Gammaproteobacteria bacterium]